MENIFILKHVYKSAMNMYVCKLLKRTCKAKTNLRHGRCVGGRDVKIRLMRKALKMDEYEEKWHVQTRGNNHYWYF